MLTGRLQSPKQQIGLYSARLWLEMFQSCHNKEISSLGLAGAVVHFDQWCWPDGGSMMDQNNSMVQAFSLIKREAEFILNEKK